MKTVRLYGDLSKKFGREHKLAVKTPAEAIRALCALIPEFKKHITSENRMYTMFTGYDDRDVTLYNAPFSEKEVLRVIPVVTGAGNLGKIIIGAVLIYFSAGLATAFVPGATAATIAAGGAGASMAAAISSIGVSLVVGGMMGLLIKPPKGNASDYEAPENKPSYAFNGSVNTTRQGNAVPVGYGTLRVGSQVVSAGISSEDLDI